MDADEDNSRKRVKLSPLADTTESSSSAQTPYHAHPPPQSFPTSGLEATQQLPYSQPSNKNHQWQYLPTSPNYYASTQYHGPPPQQLPFTGNSSPYHQLQKSQSPIKNSQQILTPAEFYPPTESHFNPPPQSFFDEQGQKASEENNKKFNILKAAEKALKSSNQDSENDWHDFLDPPSFADMDSMPIMASMSKRPSRQKTSEPPPEMIAIKPELIDDSEPAMALREFVAIVNLECSACGRLGWEDLKTALTRLCEQFRLEKMAGSDAPSELTIKGNMLCESCAQITCLGCRVYGPVLVDQDAVHGIQVAWHCEKGKLINVWFVLAAYDSLASHNKPRERVFSKKETKSVPARRNGGGSGLPAGVGYDSGYGDEYLAAMGPPFGQVPPNLAPSGQAQPGGSVAGLSGGSKAAATEKKFSDSLLFLDGVGEGQMSPPPSWGSFSTPSLGVGQAGALLGSYGAMAGPSARESAATPPLREAATDPEDGLLTKVVAVLLSALPSGAAGASPAGSEPPGLLLDMLLRSSLLDRVAEILQNGTIEEICRRPAVFKAVTDLVRAVAIHPATSPAVFRPRRANRAGHHLLHVSMGKRTRMQVESDDESRSIMACLGALAAKSRLMMQSTAKKDYQAYSLQEVFICQDLVKLHNFMLANAEDNVNELRKDSAVTDDLERLKELAFLEVPDEDILAVHAYASQGYTMGVSKPGRFRALVKEVTILQDGLPPGIYVRYGSSRLDIMKILITGSQGTPYENGLFEFDLFCSENFPNSPPKMKFRTTGGGTVRFNPNLYNDGKVCLSLLGTWEGEPWKPGQSSILQILLSLQAMVMCEQPHCNEPGYERDHNTERSKEYNRRLLPHTVRYAMLEWLGEKQVDPTQEMRSRRHGLFDTDFDNLKSAARPAKAGIWDDVVKHHFAAAEPAILATVDEWVEDKREHNARRERSMRTRAEAAALEAERSAAGQEKKKDDEAKDTPAPQGLVPRLKAAMEVLGVRGPSRSAQTPPMMNGPAVFQYSGPGNPNPASTGGSQFM